MEISDVFPLTAAVAAACPIEQCTVVVVKIMQVGNIATPSPVVKKGVSVGKGVEQ